MRSLTRRYWTPVIIALVLLTAVGFWAGFTVRSFHDMSRDRSRRFAFGVFDAVQGTLRALADHGRFRRNQVERVLKGIIGHSPLRFVVLEQDGGRIIQVGNVPPDLALPSEGETGEILKDNLTIYWQRVRLQQEPSGVTSSVAVPEAAYDLKLSASSQILALGVGFPPERRGPRPPIRALMVTVIAIVLFVGASTIAWIMTIRSGLLAEQLEVERSRRNHLEELGLAAAGLAHETKNPLGIILGLAQRISVDKRVPEEGRSMAEHIMDEVDKATARVGGFLTFARQRTPTPALIDAQAMADKVTQVIQPDFDSCGVRLVVDCIPLQILADEEMMSQILINLLLNSLHASSAGSKVGVSVEAEGKRARLTVEDEGAGIAPELLPDIFKPYVSGSPDGHGLGLAVVKRFVEQHGWSIGVESKVGAGTRVTISGIRTVDEGASS